jgi:hypothetical protein
MRDVRVGQKQGCSRTVGVTLPVNDLLGSDMGGVTTPDRSDAKGAARTDQGRSRTVGFTLPVNDQLGSDMGGVTTPDRSDSKGAARTVRSRTAANSFSRFSSVLCFSCHAIGCGRVAVQSPIHILCRSCATSRELGKRVDTISPDVQTEGIFRGPAEELGNQSTRKRGVQRTPIFSNNASPGCESTPRRVQKCRCGSQLARRWSHVPDDAVQQLQARFLDHSRSHPV